MKSFVSNLAYTNPIFFRLYYELVRKRRGRYPRLPQKTDDFYFDGYPRSGNTYTANLIKHFFPGLNWTHHLHVEATLKIALRKKLRSFIILRNPMDAVASFTFTKNRRKDVNKIIIEQSLSRYVDYYTFIEKVKNRVVIIDFDFVINDPNTFLKRFIRINNLDEGNFEVNLSRVAEYNQKMIEMEETKDLEYSSLPSADRKLYKESIIESVINHHKFPKAKEIYEGLSKQAMK